MKIEEMKLEGARIVEYEPRYAAGVAKMWNSSSEGWNGEDWDMTEEKVLNEESSGEYITLKLVVSDDDEVLGYGKLEEYKDNKSVYIPLLNVVPAHHGKKYGKALVLSLLKKAVDSCYKRLDLHSWAGNTKAVPLYKKMGFRWQTNRRGVYMMNYLPLLMNLEVLKPYFEEINWYRDSICDLSLEPDSVMQRGFETLNYRWEKDGKFIEASFNIESKGLHRLACNDFDITLSAKDKDLFLGKREISLNIKNCQIHKSIMAKFNGTGAISAKEETFIDCNDEVNKVIDIEVLDEKKDEEINSVKLDLQVSGKNVPFALGIEPKAPVSVSLQAEEKIFRPGKCDLFLQLINNQEKDTEVSLKILSAPCLTFIDNDINIVLKGKEKKALKLKCEITKGSFYDKKITVITKTGGEEIKYIQRLRCLLPDKGTVIYGEKENSWFIHQKNIHLKFGKDRTFAPFYFEIENADFWFFFKNPKLSEPYSKEFNNQKPEKIEFIEEGEDVLMKSQFTSRSKKIRAFHHILYKKDCSMVSRWEIKNLTDEILHIDQVESCFDISATHGGYDGKIIEMTERERDNYWLNLSEDKKMSGWDYFKTDKMNAALIWDKDLKHSSGEYWQRVFYDFGDLKPGESRFIGCEELLINKFSSWKDFYYWYYRNDNYPEVSSIRQLTANKGNPFAENEIDLDYIDLSHSSGTKKIKIFANDVLHKELEYISEQINLKMPFTSKIRLESTSGSLIQEVSERVFKKVDQAPVYDIQTDEEKSINVLKTECLELKTSESFLSGIFSLKYNGIELFSSSFPKAVPRGWDNNWRGGLTTKPLSISSTLLDKQKVRMGKISREDNHGNNWEGFAFYCKYDEDIKCYGGVEVKYNYLLSPSQDILAVFPEVICTGGKFIPMLRFNSSFYLNENNKMNFHTDNAVLRISDKMGGMSELTATQVELTGDNQFINCIADEGKLHITMQSGMGAIVAELNIRNIKSDSTSSASPLIIALSPEKLGEDDLKSLRDLKWR